MQRSIKNMLIRKNLCVVFDLDDTLYNERDYQLSGFRAVSFHCQIAYGKDVLFQIMQWDASGEQDIFGRLCSLLEIPSTCKEAFIWIYRNHVPSITLSPLTVNVLDYFIREAVSVAILTDGRSTTQRLKINALGLSHLPAFISEEWGDVKPGTVRFEAIQKEVGADEYWYVGDNPKKDFLAPNQLGWKSIGLKGGNRNIHSQDTTELSADYLPKHWISNLGELLDLT